MSTLYWKHLGDVCFINEKYIKSTVKVENNQQIYIRQLLGAGNTIMLVEIHKMAAWVDPKDLVASTSAGQQPDS